MCCIGWKVNLICTFQEVLFDMAFGTSSSGVSGIKRRSETPPVASSYNLTSSVDPSIRAQSDESHAMKLKIKVNTYLEIFGYPEAKFSFGVIS